MRKRSLIASAAAAAIAFGLLVASPAHAATPDLEGSESGPGERSAPPRDKFSDVEGEPTQGLVAEPVEGGDAAAFAGSLASPSGCVGETHYAHWSIGNYASVHGDTTCKIKVGSLGVTTILQKQGWLYWESMVTKSSSMTASNWSKDATPHWLCAGWGSQNYRGVSTHWSQETSGRYSTTTVGVEKRFGC